MPQPVYHLWELYLFTKREDVIQCAGWVAIWGCQHLWLLQVVQSAREVVLSKRMVLQSMLRPYASREENLSLQCAAYPHHQSEEIPRQPCKTKYASWLPCEGTRHERVRCVTGASTESASVWSFCYKQSLRLALCRALHSLYPQPWWVVPF